MKIGQVIYIDFPHPSFKWANGLKIVLSMLKWYKKLTTKIRNYGKSKH